MRNIAYRKLIEAGVSRLQPLRGTRVWTKANGVSVRHRYARKSKMAAKLMQLEYAREDTGTPLGPRADVGLLDLACRYVVEHNQVAIPVNGFFFLAQSLGLSRTQYEVSLARLYHTQQIGIVPTPDPLRRVTSFWVTDLAFDNYLTGSISGYPELFERVVDFIVAHAGEHPDSQYISKALAEPQRVITHIMKALIHTGWVVGSIQPDGNAGRVEDCSILEAGLKRQMARSESGQGRILW